MIEIHNVVWETLATIHKGLVPFFLAAIGEWPAAWPDFELDTLRGGSRSIFFVRVLGGGRLGFCMA